MSDVLHIWIVYALDENDPSVTTDSAVMLETYGEDECPTREDAKNLRDEDWPGKALFEYELISGESENEKGPF